MFCYELWFDCNLFTVAADKVAWCEDAVDDEIVSSARCLRNLMSGTRLAAENCNIVRNTILSDGDI